MSKISIGTQWLIIISLFVLLISGCSTAKTRSDSILEPTLIGEPLSNIQDDDALIVIPPPEKKTFASIPVVQGLLNKSRRKFEKGEFVAAANFLERGINITPNNPKLWQQLAVIRFEQGDYRQAKQLAAKSNILTEGDDELRAINENIIKRANRLLGP